MPGSFHSRETPVEATQPAGTHYASRLLAQLKEAARRIRLLRAIAGAARAALFVHIVLLPLLVLKEVSQFPAEWYLIVLLLSAMTGALIGLMAKLSLLTVARRLDARLGLKERLQSAHEFRVCPERPLVGALIQDAAARAEQINAAKAFPLALPHDARYLPLVLGFGVILLWLPALPIPGLSAIDTGDGQLPETARAESAGKTDRSGGNAEETPQPESQRGQHQTLEDHRVAFKDTPFAAQPPDFVSFLNSSDDRLSMLDPSQSPPDPNQRAGQDPYRVSFEPIEAGRTFESSQFSEQDANERVQELANIRDRPPTQDSGEEKQGAKPPQPTGGGTSRDDRRGDSETSPYPGADQQKEDAKETGLQRRQHGDVTGKRFAGLQYPHDAPGTGLPPWLKGPNDPGFQDAGPGSADSTGKTSGQPGVGHSMMTEDPETQRIDVRAEQNLQVRGQRGEGPQVSYDTSLLGPGATVSSRLPYQRRRTSYTRGAEDVLSKEWVPFDYREHVKGYFSGIESRQ
ncbi:MAG: hypothetical protein ACR2RB_11000 [Gammaproteobacteria bacterium]